MSIDALPAAPAPTDSVAAFDTKAFALLAALAPFVTQTNATAVDMQTNADITAALALGMALPNYAGTSTTSLVVGTGAKSFTTQTGKSWVPGQVVVATNGANLMKGTVTAYSGATLDVNVTTISGSGTFASWTIGLSYAGLVLAASGANSDITGLSALIGPGLVPVGAVIHHAANTAPTGFLKANGAAISRTTYAALFAALYKSAVVTMTIATPGVITWTAHGRSANDPVQFTTTGALPTGLVAATTYYVVGASITTNTFQLSATPGGAAINTTGTQSGVHTAIHAPYGIGDGSTTFTLPDYRGEFPRGWDDGRGVDANRAFGSAQLDQMQGHFHTADQVGPAASGIGANTFVNQRLPAANTSGPVSDGTNGTPRTGAETRPRNVALLACIKY